MPSAHPTAETLGGAGITVKIHGPVPPARKIRTTYAEHPYQEDIFANGYSVFWAELLLSSKISKKFIWMHNDLMLDSEREIEGNRPHHKNLTSLFSLYSDFDKIVSVSNDLNAINRDKMRRFADSDKFVSVRNLVDSAQIIELAKELRDVRVSERGTKFVTVGRLSPEKNQSRMIRAMKLVLGEVPDAHLYIIGSGPLEPELRSLVAALDIRANIHFLGFHRNPHVIVNQCDCFVFSSIYEGQGLAVIEAMILGKPVVTTRYNVVDSVVGPDDGIVTESTDRDLANGLLHFIHRGLPRPRFDPDQHNAAGIEEIKTVFGSKN